MPGKILGLRLWIVGWFLCCYHLSCNAILPREANIPGGVSIINLETSEAKQPVVYYLGNRTIVLPDPKNINKWLAIIGIPLDADPGVHHIEIQNKNNTKIQNFIINRKEYSTQRLKIANKRKVQPSLDDLPLIEQQYLETIETYKLWSQQELSSLLLNMPVEGRKSSPFGLTRIMNDIPQNPHSGLDIAAPIGTPVKVAKSGTVINVGHYFYSGNIVFVDHGQGLITSYSHLDKILVSKGQKLKTDEVLGTIGKTGRATGPHLHWSVSLNGVRVDPELFIYG